MKFSEIGLINLFVFNLIIQTEAQCTFPTDLRANTLSGYSIPLSASYSSVDFECKTLINDQYYLRGTATFSVLATTIEATINDRIYANTFEVGTFVMLIKDGADDASLAVKCPTDGLWRCLYYTNSGSTTYLAALNMDAALVSGQTYRMVCYTFQRQDDVLKATTHHGSCLPDQTASSVVSPGNFLTMSDISDRGRVRELKAVDSLQKDPEHGFDLVPFYVGAIALALLVIGCIGVCVNYRHYKNADKPNRVHTIKVKEMNNIPKRESTSGIFSYSSTSLDGDDHFRISSTPIQKTRTKRIRQKITSHPSTLSRVLQYYGVPPNNHRIKNNLNVYDDIHKAYFDHKHLKKTANVETAEDFYRNQKIFVDKGLLPRKVLQADPQKPQKAQKAQKQNVALTVNQNISYGGNNIREDRLIKFSERHNIYGQDRQDRQDRQPTKTKVDPSVNDEGPSARGRGDITNTVHYFNRRIPMHWK
ncbi:unnamed protein product [Mytilus edulis]|uniref:CUB domain-containing protein n=1 Tax=Mytilus edulis TaxID=6550 RepID=A0A8S3S4B5_MYTED|nr:unnamed protein product [Mytilus edulis]